LVEYLQSAEELRDEVISALTYPLILVGVGGISVAILLVFVLPKFATMFADLGQALPLSTRMMLSFSHACTSPWSLIGVPLVVAGIFGIYRYFSTAAPGVRRLQAPRAGGWQPAASHRGGSFARTRRALAERRADVAGARHRAGGRGNR
jgi:type II secretory pathway component PulF